MSTRSVPGVVVILALLLIALLFAVPLLVSHCRLPVTRRYRNLQQYEVPLPSPVPARPDLGLRLARWLGMVCGRLWREFYYWTVGDDE
jgi:hypothetical protein